MKVKCKAIDVSQIEQFRNSKYNTWQPYHMNRVYFLIKDLANFIEKRGKIIEYEDGE